MNKTSNSSLPTLTILFFLWGFVTCLNDILIPYLKKIFTLTTFMATMVQFAFFGAYFIGSLIYFIYSTKIGDPINKYGYKKGIQFGLALSALGCLLFVPASILEVYAIFLIALFVLGFGFTALQISANPLVTLLGDPESSSARLNLTQGFNAFGTTIAPILGGYLIFEYFSTNGVMTADNVRMPYVFLAAIFILMMFVIQKSNVPELKSDEVQGAISIGEVLKFKQLKMGILAIFCYVGAEVAIGSLLINYLGLEEIAGMSENEASKYLAFYWGGAMIGRFLGALNMSSLDIAKKLGLSVLAIGVTFGLVLFTSGLAFEQVWPFLIYVAVNFVVSFAVGNRPDRVLAIFSGLNVALITMALNGIGGLMWPLLAIGLFNSIMWSNIFSLAIKGLGDKTSMGSSLLVMAILGGALMPPIQGYIVDTVGFAISFVVPAIGYGYLLFYGLTYKKLVGNIDDTESVSAAVSH